MYSFSQKITNQLETDGSFEISDIRGDLEKADSKGKPDQDQESLQLEEDQSCDVKKPVDPANDDEEDVCPICLEGNLFYFLQFIGSLSDTRLSRHREERSMRMEIEIHEKHNSLTSTE